MQLQITAPDDWHIHLRDNDALATTVPHAQQAFCRVLAMPNLVPPITTVQMAMDYRTRILAHAPDFGIYMALYLTDHTTIQDIENVAKNPHILGLKLYPFGTTTNSQNGVTDIKGRYEIFAAMQTLGVPLLVHGEVNRVDVDIFDQEKVFYHEVLSHIVQDFPTLRVVCEHITTADAVEFVQQAHTGVAATITPQHLLYHRNHLLKGGVRPHFYCLPILKRASHQQALIDAATSDSGKFFAGTDSAPHAIDRKECTCGCAGCYTAPFAMSMYATAFENAEALDKLENFVSVFGARFYGLPISTHKITLRKQAQAIATHYPYMDSTLVPLLAGETIAWTVL